jgi:selenide,water dikinase
MEDVRRDVAFPEAMPEARRFLLADAQTSGGLLMAVPPDRLECLLEKLAEKAPAAAVIGDVEEGPAGRIQVL